MFQGCKTWKLKNQVLTIFLIQTSILITALLLIDLYTYPHISDLFQKNSKTLMIRQNHQSTIFIQYLTVKNISLILNRSLRQIVNANYLFQYSIGLEYQFIQQPLDCLDNPKSVDKYSYKSSVCYGNFGVGQQHTFEDKQLLNYTALTTTLIPMYESFTFFYAQKTANYLFTQWPGQNLTSYNPHQRAWYITYMENKDNSLTTFCTPYLSNSNTYVSAQATGLNYKNGTNVAVIANALAILNILKTTQQNMNISIVDETGLIYTVGQQNATQIYLENESYTGFNSNQQIEILATLNNESILLYNSQVKKNISISARSLYKTGLILIFQSNPLFQQEIINQHLIDTQDSIFSRYQQAMIIWALLTLFCIIISVILLIVILKPITELTMIMKKAISPLTSKQVLQLYLRNKKESQLTSFQNAFRKMTTSISQNMTHKNTQCILMNNLQCYASVEQIENVLIPLINYLGQGKNYSSRDYDLNIYSKDIFYYELQRQIFLIQ